MKLKYTIPALLLLFTCMVISCQKENNRITGSLYQLDSVRIKFNYPTDSSTFIIPINQSNLDSIISINSLGVMPPYGVGFYTSNDSLNYVNHPDLFDLYKSSISNKKLIYYSNFFPVGSAAQEGYTDKKYYYKYDASEKAEKIYSTYKSHSPYNDSDLLIKTTRYFNYTGNNLTGISENNIRCSYYNNSHFSAAYDSIIYPERIRGIFSYSSAYSNQTDIIGIDLNDLLLDNYIGARSNLELNNWHLIFILHSRLSYNTKNSKLIEYMEYDSDYSGDISLTLQYNIVRHDILSVQYSFDETKNNRVNTMKITTVNDQGTTYTNYTFYYKD